MLSRFLSAIRGNVIACLALFVALGGTGYAATRLPAHSVGAAQLKDHSVSAEKVRAHALDAGTLARNSVGASQLKSGAVTAAKVHPHSLTADAFAPGTLPTITSAQLRTRVMIGTVPAGGACAAGVSFCGIAGQTTWNVGCNRGEQVVGGGFSGAGNGVVVTASRPYISTPPYNPAWPPPASPPIGNLTGTGDQGWTVSLDGPDNVDQSGSRFYAVCAQVS